MGSPALVGIPEDSSALDSARRGALWRPMINGWKKEKKEKLKPPSGKNKSEHLTKTNERKNNFVKSRVEGSGEGGGRELGGESTVWKN